ncbi:ABC transporter substrate-binding protein [Streptomyces sp. NPDC002795]|uniref:ABC transporter substrate-binding protein n=1 Tax=Streptomyces sp. NPDC002795 TaxID=3364665 RepID=UPI0036C7C6B1
MFDTFQGGRRCSVRRALSAGIVLALTVTGCGATAGGSVGSQTPSAFTFLSATENPQVADELKSLAAGPCKAQDTALPLKIQTLPQAEVNNRVTLLASQKALPVMFISPTEQAKEGGDMNQAGALVDLSREMERLGVRDDLLPAATDVAEAAYGSVVSLPFQYNIEGFWYNKALFRKAGITVPTTWSGFLKAADRLKSRGVQPLTASGAQPWTITRYLSTYLARTVGVKALEQVKEGKARLTDPRYVRAARQLAALGTSKFFGDGVTSRDYNSMMQDFFGGTAAMMYQSSSVLANVYDTKTNTVGRGDVGFFPFPAVSGGKGHITDYPSTTGTVTALSAVQFNGEVGDWVSCIARNYGSSLLNHQGAISGFRRNQPVKESRPLVRDILRRMQQTTGSFPWFEAQFSQRFADLATLYAPYLLDGSMSPSTYMKKLQNSLDAGR